MASIKKYPYKTSTNTPAQGMTKIADDARFQAMRLAIERTTERIRQFANRPSGDDEIQQYIAENAVFNKTSETDFLNAENCDPVPGNARSDSLKSDSKLESELNTGFIDRRSVAKADRHNSSHLKAAKAR